MKRLSNPQELPSFIVVHVNRLALMDLNATATASKTGTFSGTTRPKGQTDCKSPSRLSANSARSSNLPAPAPSPACSFRAAQQLYEHQPNLHTLHRSNTCLDSLTWLIAPFRSFAHRFRLSLRTFSFCRASCCHVAVGNRAL